MTARPKPGVSGAFNAGRPLAGKSQSVPAMVVRTDCAPRGTEVRRKSKASKNKYRAGMRVPLEIRWSNVQRTVEKCS